MKIVRYLAVAATALMSLMNIPVAFDHDVDTPTPVAWAATVVGVLGLVFILSLFFI